jgi:superfamily II DNA or RNA helicase
VKPLHSRQGWTNEQVEAYNRERFVDLVSAGWDLVIVDEAHRLGGSTEQMARFKLGQGLADATPHLLLLSATPHQGKTDAFNRLLSLIDRRQFADLSAVTRDRVRPYVIRTEKRHAIDADGNPLFKARRTEMCAVSWQPRHRSQELLYEAVTDYVREGYNQASREKRNYVGFLMVLLQRLVVSSTSAIRATLEKRLEVLGTSEEQLTLFPPGADEWSDVDGQEQLETLLRVQMKALGNEREEVKLLLETAARCEQGGPDAKAEALLDWLYRLQAEEGDPELKVLVFTEFVPTQQMLHRFLTDRGFSVVCLNGSMDMEERRRVQDAFAKEVRILVSTDAGGEGLNLQFCHVVINYDIPWNPMRLEQRIGRVDRIGQSRVVRAVNFVFEGSVEKRVREVLEEKLAVIFEEFGIDKTSDVLDSSQAQQVFDKAFISAILNPDKVEDSVAEALAKLRGEAQQARDSMSVLGTAESLQPGEAQRLRAHPLPHWVERMTVSYLAAQGGHAERTSRGWELAWPDGHIDSDVVFTSREAAQIPGSRHITVEEPRVRSIITRLTLSVPGQPVPEVTIPGLSAEITGFWSMWRIGIRTSDDERLNILPLFLSDDGRVLNPTARHIWDQLLDCDPVPLGSLDTVSSQSAAEHLRAVAEAEGKAMYDALVQRHVSELARERDKAQFAFSARRRAIEQIGLSQVRDHRLQVLAKEEEAFYEGMKRRSGTLPHLEPLIVIRVRGER